MSAKPYPLVVKRVFFEQFARGEKTVEYRRHGGIFTAERFWPGREISIRYRYDQTGPRLTARVTRFEVARLDTLAGELVTVLKTIYPALVDTAEIALIHLEMIP